MTDARTRELSRLRIKAGLPVLMTYEEAINWIAFGQVSEADLTGKAKFGAKWVAAYAENDIRQTEPSEDGSDCAVLRVLRALAETVPVWTSNAPRDANWQRYSEAHPEADFVPPAFQEVEYAARNLIRKYGRSAAELAVEMQADLNTYAKCKAQEAEAERGLDAAQIDGLLRAAERQPTPRFKGVDILELWPNPKLEEGEPRNLPQSRMLREAKRWAAQRLKAWPKDHAPPRQAQDWENAKIRWPDPSRRPSRDVIHSLRPDAWPVKLGRPLKQLIENSRK